jgi:hypothetical protein
MERKNSFSQQEHTESRSVHAFSLTRFILGHKSKNLKVEMLSSTVLWYTVQESFTDIKVCTLSYENNAHVVLYK